MAVKMFLKLDSNEPFSKNLFSEKLNSYLCYLWVTKLLIALESITLFYPINIKHKVVSKAFCVTAWLFFYSMCSKFNNNVIKVSKHSSSTQTC